MSSKKLHIIFCERTKKHSIIIVQKLFWVINMF